MRICPCCTELYPDDRSTCPECGSRLREARDRLIGTVIGDRFRLIRKLGLGGMSTVYLARHEVIERLNAIKILHRELASDPVQRDRFLREARAVNRIDHPNIVEITDLGETEDGLIYLVMEYIDGEQLLDVVDREGPLDPFRALYIAEQCASALGAAHQMEVIHRDFKPDNILLVRQGEDPSFVKILDFGIAKILDAPTLTGSKQIFGTPGYIAPEYIRSSAIDGRADLYSLGAVLYEMVTGALPYDYRFPNDLLVKHLSEPPIPPRERLPSLPEPVEALILRSLRKDPNERFRDAYHFQSEIKKTVARLRELQSP